MLHTKNCEYLNIHITEGVTYRCYFNRAVSILRQQWRVAVYAN